MEFTKIEAPIAEYLNESLDEAACDKLLEDIKYVLNSDKPNKAINEVSGADLLPVVLGGGLFVGAIIKIIRDYIKGKYTLNIKKIYGQSKELNDLYTKVEYMLTQDKKARKAHKNDPVSCDVKRVCLHDPKNPNTKYQMTNDLLVYSDEWFVKELESRFEYVKAHSTKETLKKDLQDVLDGMIETLEKGFENNHWFTRCNPIISSEHYENIRLESALMYFKQEIEVIYNNTAVYNKTVKNEMTGLQFIEQAYNKMVAKYPDKEYKKVIDAVYKFELANVTKSIEFNNRCMEAYIELINFYVNELEKIYDYLKSFR